MMIRRAKFIWQLEQLRIPLGSPWLSSSLSSCSDTSKENAQLAPSLNAAKGEDGTSTNRIKTWDVDKVGHAPQGTVMHLLSEEVCFQVEKSSAVNPDPQELLRFLDLPSKSSNQTVAEEDESTRMVGQPQFYLGRAEEKITAKELSIEGARTSAHSSFSDSTTVQTSTEVEMGEDGEVKFNDAKSTIEFQQIMIACGQKDGMDNFSYASLSKEPKLLKSEWHVNDNSDFNEDEAPTSVGSPGSEGKEQAECLSYRIEKLLKGESVGLAFQNWMGDGFPIHRGDIYHAINRLRKLKRNKRALEMMEWVIRERPYKLNELEYSYLLEFTTRLHGVSQGEKLFSRIPQEFQNALVYNNFVIACLQKGIIRTPLIYMKKMRELGYGISHLVFNHLIVLHSSPHRRKYIPKILAQMKADKVLPHVSTYNILMKIEANEHNIEGLVKIFGDMNRVNVKADEVSYCILGTAHAVARLYTATEAYIQEVEKSMTGTNWSTLEILIILYGYLGKAKELEKVWMTVKELPRVRCKSYILVIESFGRTRHLTRAEELWKEMASLFGLRSIEQYNSLLSVYCKHGIINKASACFREMVANGCKPNAITYRHLALGCSKAGLIDEALKTLDMGSRSITSLKVKRSMPWLETTFCIMEIFSERGDVGNSERLFEELTEAKYSRYTFVFNTLIKAYVKAKVYEPNLLRRMILGGSQPDAETYSLIKLCEQFRT